MWRGVCGSKWVGRLDCSALRCCLLLPLTLIPTGTRASSNAMHTTPQPPLHRTAPAGVQPGAGARASAHHGLSSAPHPTPPSIPRRTAPQECSAALELEPRYTKALLRRSAAYEKLDDLERALADAQKVCGLMLLWGGWVGGWRLARLVAGALGLKHDAIWRAAVV